MKMKTLSLIGAFSLAFAIAGCTAAAPTPGPAGPTGATGATGDPAPQDPDLRRAQDQKIADDQRRADNERHHDADAQKAEEQKRIDVARDARGAVCPDGEHIYTDREGQRSCVRN